MFKKIGFVVLELVSVIIIVKFLPLTSYLTCPSLLSKEDGMLYGKVKLNGKL